MNTPNLTLLKNTNVDIYSARSNIPRLDLATHVPLPGPLSVYIETTNVCNLRCTFCPESLPDYADRVGGLHTMHVDSFKRIADQLKEMGTLQKVWFQEVGEPFANKSLLECIRYASKIELAPRLFITSNGTLIKPRLWDEICNSGLHHLKISIYGGTEELHKERTKSPISLEQIKQNVWGLKRFRDAGGFTFPRIYVKMIQQTPEENKAFLEGFKHVGDEIDLESVWSWNGQGKDFSGLGTDKMLATDYFANKKEVCPYIFWQALIHSDLTVSPCTVDWNKQGIIGDLKTHTFREIWEGDRRRMFMEAHVRRSRHSLMACKDCTYLHGAVDNADGVKVEQFLERQKK